MGKQHVDAASKEAPGRVEASIGKIPDHRKDQDYRSPGEMRGTGQNAFGSGRDTVRDAIPW